MNNDLRTAIDILPMVRSCAESVYVGKAPTPEYQDRVTRMLMGTAAQESGFTWRRQRSFPWASPSGGFSLWQVEYKTSVLPSLAKLADTPELLDRATLWLWQDDRASTDWIHEDAMAMFFALRGWDRLGCLMARLHYLRVPAAIPDSLDEQFSYWLKYYNGGGVLKHVTADIAALQYKGAYDRLVKPAIAAVAQAVAYE